MVRTAVDRIFLPLRSAIETFGAVGVLAGKTIVSALRPPYPYGGEFVAQFLFALRLCWLPMIVAAICFTYGPSGIQTANFLNLFGAFDPLGVLFLTAVVR